MPPPPKNKAVSRCVKSSQRSSSPLDPSSTADNSDWSFSFLGVSSGGGGGGGGGANDSDSDGMSDNDDIFGTSFLPQLSQTNDNKIYDDDSDSDSEVVFEASSTAGGGGATAEVSESDESLEEDRAEKRPVVQMQFMYIQMEYCDKQTLRSAIDDG